MLKVADIRARLDDERGIAMITVVIIGMVLFLLAAVMAARSISSLNQVVAQRSWERALHVAETGIHRTLYELVNDQTYNTGDPAISGTGGSVHSNQNVTISGDPTIAGTATAVGDYDLNGNPTIGDEDNSG